MRKIQPQINKEDKLLMQRLLSTGHLEQKFAQRLQTVLLREKGKGTGEIAEFLGMNRATVSSYINRYNAYGINALLNDKTRKPGKEPVSQEIKNEICRLACNEKPKDETHWSSRTLAKRVGISHTKASQVLQEYGLKPHITAKRNYSNDPDFKAKLTDVVGLYLKPPKNAIIWCVDEKTQIQALERTQPVLPIIRNVPERQTVDYERHGTTTLFAALDYLSGRVIGECKGFHSSEDYINFLKKIDKGCPPRKVLHIVTDNLSAHKTKEVYKYLESRPGRFVLHFIPTHSSWLNLVERWFSEITNKRIRRGNFESVPQLIRAIKDYIRTWNKSGRSFTWTKKPSEILAKIEKAKSC
ncbi:IS630 family transposase [Treponema sp. R80B11-R83G3]